jgi:hypothetical protein
MTHAQSDDLDLFQVKREAPAAQKVEPQKQTETKPLKANAQGAEGKPGKGIQGWHILAVATLAGVAWIVWPMVQPKHANVSKSHVVSNVAPAHAESRPAPVPEQIKEAPSDEITELREIVARQGGELSDLKALSASLHREVADLAAQLKANEQAQQAENKLATVTRERKTVSEQKPRVIARSNPKLEGFSINTIYRDQVWLTSGDKTFVATTGDTIDGFKITKIDPNTRRVYTSQGIIK